MDELVSIVIPVYKTEKYLDRCVESVVQQTYTNLEILLIDDGSPDACPQMCEDWAKKDRRIRVIHKQNAGLGMARNTGIAHAHGTYICFVDSDDFVDRHTIEHSYHMAKAEQADLVIFGLVLMDRHGKLIRKEIPERACYCGAEVQNDLLPNLVYENTNDTKMRNLSLSACRVLFSMDLIAKAQWLFVSERELISEDIYSQLALYKSVKRVAVLDEALYYYCVNFESLTHTHLADRYLRVRYFYQACKKLCAVSGYTEAVLDSCTSLFLGYTLGVLKQEVKFYSGCVKAIRQIKAIIDDEVLQEVLYIKRKENYGLKKNLMFLMMRLKCYVGCYCLLALQNIASSRIA